MLSEVKVKKLRKRIRYKIKGLVGKSEGKYIKECTILLFILFLQSILAAGYCSYLVFGSLSLLLVQAVVFLSGSRVI